MVFCPPVEAWRPDVCVVALGDAAKREVLPLARDLRRAGLSCEISRAGGGPSKQSKAAHKREARFAVVLGEDELAKGTVSVKDLSTGNQIEIARAELAGHLLAAAGPAPAASAGTPKEKA